MPSKQSYITVTDQFCGAGGSSQGAVNSGAEVRIALNHWQKAIDTHQANFPKTDHDCTDISACDPRRYQSTDILITSPECTNHSLAKGQKVVQKQMDLFASGAMDAAAERSRATMWDVPRFAEYHRYNAIIVENVVDARKWVMFDAWLMAMYALGYNHKCVYLNSMHCHPTPQSRDRMYVVFWKKGNKVPMLDYLPMAHCVKCGKDVQALQTWKKQAVRFGKYKQQYVYCCTTCTSVVEPYYYAAFNCIDWSDTGTRIGDRKKPLSENTVKRIEYGLKKYGRQAFQIHTAYGKEARGVVRSLNEPSFTHTTVQSQAFIVNDQHSTGIDFRVKSVRDQLPSVTTVPNLKLFSPFVLKSEHSHAEPSGKVKSIAQALQTQTTRQSTGLVIPYIIEMNKTGECKPASEAAATITAGGINHAMLTSPFIVNHHHSSKANSLQQAMPTQCTNDKYGLFTNEAWDSFISYYYGTSQASHITDALGSTRTKDCYQLISHQQPAIEDCYYRMLKPDEIKLAMAFGKDYVVLGSGKDQVKQLGNAVTPPAMEWLVKEVIESLN